MRLGPRPEGAPPDTLVRDVYEAFHDMSDLSHRKLVFPELGVATFTSELGFAAFLNSELQALPALWKLMEDGGGNVEVNFDGPGSGN